MRQNIFYIKKFTFTTLLHFLLLALGSCEACSFLNKRNESRRELSSLLEKDNVQLVEYVIQVEGYSHDFWSTVGNHRWFQPWRWFRAKDNSSKRLLLLLDYYYGLLRPDLSIGKHSLNLDLAVNVTGCLNGLSALQLETVLRQFLYNDLKNETEKLSAESREDILVCSMHVGDNDGWGRLEYYCCSPNDIGHESCTSITDDEWVWTLRAFIFIMSALLFLYFPRLIPKGYSICSFHYYPSDELTFNLLLTASHNKYKYSPQTAFLPASRWQKMRKFAAEVSKLQTDVVHRVKVRQVTFECEMDRLLSESSSPVSFFSDLFDSLVRCKVRHTYPVEDCCNSPVCGDLCCTNIPPWHIWLAAVRTVLLMLLLTLPSLPILYAMCAENLEYQLLAKSFKERGLQQSSNFYPGSIFGKIVVVVLAAMYLLHMLLLVIDGCHDQNLIRAYAQVLDITQRKVRLHDRIQHSQKFVRKVLIPIKRFGVLAILAGLLLLVLLPFILVVYLIVTSPIPKLMIHIVRLLYGLDADRHRKTKAELSSIQILENVLFVTTLIAVFVVLTLGFNFLVQVLVILLVQVLVDLTFFMTFLPVVALLLIYIRDSFKVVNSTYSSHRGIIMRYISGMKEEDLKCEAGKNRADQENRIFKVTPVVNSRDRCLCRENQEDEEYQTKELFFVRKNKVRMHTQSLVLYLDKDDIPYIPKKFLFHTTNMACPGSPGPLDEAYIRAMGRLGYTTIFLLFILLVVKAFANTYYISPTNTSTLRFQIQLKEKLKSFLQSWAVEDILVAKFSPPEDYDQLYPPHHPEMALRETPLHTNKGLTVELIDTKKMYLNSKAKKPTIDLVLDVSEDSLGHLKERSGKVSGAAKCPNIHWNRCSRLVQDEKTDHATHSV